MSTMGVILLMTLIGIALAIPSPEPLSYTSAPNNDEYDTTMTTQVTPTQNYSEAVAVLKLNMSTKENFSENIIKYLFQDRASLQERVNELNKDNCELRNQLSQFTENTLNRLETEVDGNFNYQSEDCTNLRHLIKTLRSEIILESQNHKSNVNTLKIEHFRTIENMKIENIQIINSLKVEINKLKSDNNEIINNLKTEYSKDVLNLRKEKQQLDEDISKLRKLRREDLAFEIAKSKNEKDLISSNVEYIKEIHDLKIFSNTLNYSNVLLIQSNSELKELNNNLSSKINNLSSDLKTLSEENKILGLNINNVTEQSKNILKDKETEWIKIKDEMLQNITECETGASKKTKNVSYNAERYHIERGKRSWKSAIDFCQSKNMELAKIETEVEKNFITEYLHEGCFWVGSTDEHEEEVWKWYGTNIFVDTESFSNRHIKSKRYNCLVMCKSMNMFAHSFTLFHSAQCRDQNYVLCENYD